MEEGRKLKGMTKKPGREMIKRQERGNKERNKGRKENSRGRKGKGLERHKRKETSERTKNERNT